MATSRARLVEAAEHERHLRTRYQGEALTAFAGLAAEVEELLGNDASPDLIVSLVRMRAEQAGLTLIGRAGRTSTYNPVWHETYAGELPAGTKVKVLRPGYRLGEHLICRALVIDL